jgi:hypothetical protein
MSAGIEHLHVVLAGLGSLGEEDSCLQALSWQHNFQYALRRVVRLVRPQVEFHFYGWCL